MKKFLALLVFGILFIGEEAFGHFGMIIPSESMVVDAKNSVFDIAVSFSHPMEMKGMDMAKPKAFGVSLQGKRKDLLPLLKEKKIMEAKAWEGRYKAEKPGSHIFFMEPEPYWEPAEDIFIVHYTKTVVPALGDEEGWDEELGLKAEIVPLARPFGLYAGNLFQGIVKVDGKPVPHATVEVEYYNRDKKAIPPNDYMIAQSVKADANGVFSFSVPKPGWWGFAALKTSDEKMNKDGKTKDVELGAVIWVEFKEWKTKK